MTSRFVILAQLTNKISELKEALKGHRKATVYDARLLGILDDILSLWSLAEEDIESQGLQELCSEPRKAFEAMRKTRSGTRPGKVRLTRQLRTAEAALRALKIKSEAKVAPHDFFRLKLRVDALQDVVLRGILQEAFRCWRIGSQRGCIVLSWCAVEAKIFYVYKTKWTIPEIKQMVPEANRKEIQVHDDLTVVSDAYLLRGLRSAGLLTATELRVLDGVCNTYRNIAAHAGQMKTISDAEVSSAVENMIVFVEKQL